jgi:GTP cyclohydrolase II
MTLTQIAEVRFPTRWACFRLLAFEDLHVSDKSGNKRIDTALALVLGNIHGFPPLVRIHSQCTTGEAFHSLRCDCHDQLHLALRAVADEGAGLVLYEQQEGRGIGLIEKLRAYELQDQGLDTVDANLSLGHPVDARDYAIPIQILHFLGIRSIRLISNNPEKIKAVLNAGIQIAERIGADVPSTPEASHYMATKRIRLGHLTNSSAAIPPVEPDSIEGAFLSDAHGNAAGPELGVCADFRGDPWQMS